MILHKFWSAFVAQINKVANLFWEADPVAQMRYEYDRAVDQLKEGRVGLEQYRGLVERVTRQAQANRGHVQKLEAETKAYLRAGDRATASKFALELQKAKEELAANEGQLQLHETAYGNNLKKIQHANEKLIELRIDQNRGKVRVAADLSNQGIAEIKAEEAMQGQLAEQALQNFEAELGLKSPETTRMSQAAKDLGPATEKQTN